MRVEPLERLQRPAGVAEVGVVVVLDDQRAAPGRPLQQPQPPRQAQRGAGRELVGGRDVHQPGRQRVVGGRQGGHVQAILVHRHRADGHAVRLQRQRRAGVARVFERRLVAGVQEEPDQQVGALLRAVDHHHLLGRAAHPARLAQVGRDGLAERPVAGRVAVRGQLLGALADLARGQPAPDLARERVPVRAARAEVERQRRRTARRRGRPRPRPGGGRRPCGRPRPRARARRPAHSSRSAPSPPRARTRHAGAAGAAPPAPRPGSAARRTSRRPAALRAYPSATSWS